MDSFASPESNHGDVQLRLPHMVESYDSKGVPWLSIYFKFNLKYINYFIINHNSYFIILHDLYIH